MVVSLNQSDSATSRMLQDMMRSMYFDGQCYELAIALNRGLEWPLIGIEQRTYTVQGIETCIRHAGVKTPDEWFFDARGKVPIEWPLDRDFGDNCTVVNFDLETDLRERVRPIQERSISAAGRLAMAVWPELPWKSDTYIQSVTAFLEDLERLSRHHGFWIRGDTNITSWPVIAVDEGDEAGYEFTSINGHSYCFNRTLK